MISLPPIRRRLQRSDGHRPGPPDPQPPVPPGAPVPPIPQCASPPAKGLPQGLGPQVARLRQNAPETLIRVSLVFLIFELSSASERGVPVGFEALSQ